MVPSAISFLISAWTRRASRTSGLVSDTASVHELVQGLLDAVGPDVRAMRDATRGGVATILNEVATAAGVAVVVEEEAVPVRPEVRGACELLGIDPLYVACEGRIVVIVDPAAADADHAGAAGTAARGHRPAEIRPRDQDAAAVFQALLGSTP